MRLGIRDVDLFSLLPSPTLDAVAPWRAAFRRVMGSGVFTKPYVPTWRCAGGINGGLGQSAARS